MIIECFRKGDSTVGNVRDDEDWTFNAPADNWSKTWEGRKSRRLISFDHEVVMD